MTEDAAAAALRGKHPLSWYRRLHTRAVWYMTQGDERDLFRALARQEARLDDLAPLVGAVARLGRAIDASVLGGVHNYGTGWSPARAQAVYNEQEQAYAEVRRFALTLARAAHDDAPEVQR